MSAKPVHRYLNQSVSTGTLRTEDLISSFRPVLQELNPDRLSQIDTTPYDDPTEQLMDLIDALDDEAPEGFRFGSHEGDGADFGFWQAE